MTPECCFPAGGGSHKRGTSQQFRMVGTGAPSRWVGWASRSRGDSSRERGPGSGGDFGDLQKGTWQEKGWRGGLF